MGNDFELDDEFDLSDHLLLYLVTIEYINIVCC